MFSLLDVLVSAVLAVWWCVYWMPTVYTNRSSIEVQQHKYIKSFVLSPCSLYQSMYTHQVKGHHHLVKFYCHLQWVAAFVHSMWLESKALSSSPLILSFLWGRSWNDINCPWAWRHLPRIAGIPISLRNWLVNKKAKRMDSSPFLL